MMTDAEHEALANYWAVHSSRDERPVMRTWANSELEAQRKLQQLRSSDPTPEDQYWVTQLTNGQVASLKQLGSIPSDA